MPAMTDLEKNLWKHFKQIITLSHGSEQENPVRDYVAQFCAGVSDVKVKWYDPKATEPGKRVVVVKKHPALASRFILQGHLDMVCVPVDMEFPLTLIEDGDWYRAREAGGRKSTLGADNGIGVAAALALLESDFPVGFECLFTVEEESSMGGAHFFDTGLLEARTLINVDSEEVDIITYGCAGGLETNYSLPLTKENVPMGQAYVELGISGLLGGHSAMCVNMGRLNAIKILNQCLRRLSLKYQFNLVSLTGGARKNAIPTEATYGAVLKFQDSSSFIQDFNAMGLELKTSHQKNEPNLNYNASSKPVPPVMLSAESTETALEMIFALPHGVIKMDPKTPDSVMTSNNLGILDTTPASLEICCFHRSSLQEELDRVSKNLETIGSFYNADWRHENGFPPWTPNLQSKILQIAKDVYGPAGSMAITHGGLECAYFYERYNGTMDCVSIGPDIRDPHSADERVSRGTVTVFLDRLIRILEVLKA